MTIIALLFQIDFIKIASRSVAQSGSAPGLGPGGRRFESFHSDHFRFLKFIVNNIPFMKYGGRSSVGRAPVCGTGCRGFEPRRPPHWSIDWEPPKKRSACGSIG